MEEVREFYQGMYYRILNPKAENVLLCLHGWGTSSHIWDALAPYLLRYCIVLPDLLGMGHSLYDGQPSYYEQMTEKIAGLLKKIGTDRLSVLAHSVGGMIAAKLVADPRVKCDKVILDSVPLLGKRGIAFKVRLFAMNPLVSAPMYRAFRSFRMTRRLVHNTVEHIDNIRPEYLYNLINDFRRASRSALYTSLTYLFRNSVIGHLTACGVPLLYIVGENNKTLNGKMMLDAIQHAIPHVHTAVVPGVRHYPQLENPEYYYRLIHSFLQ
jgi:pimeloyl-ACP methyl ester carboxylesterase